MQKAFTLVEVLIVITVLTALAGGVYSNFNSRAEETTTKYATSQTNPLKSPTFVYEDINGRCDYTPIKSALNDLNKKHYANCAPEDVQLAVVSSSDSEMVAGDGVSPRVQYWYPNDVGTENCPTPSTLTYTEATRPTGSGTFCMAYRTSSGTVETWSVALSFTQGDTSCPVGSALIDGTCVAHVDADGDGLIDITTLEQLNNVRHDLNGTSYKTSTDDAGNSLGCPRGECIGYELLNDIDAVSFTNWEPIGNVDIAFTATFDGNGYKIENLKINQPTESLIGLFGRVGNSGTIKNVGVVNVSALGYDGVGGLVGVNDGTIENSHASGSVSGRDYIGGLAGYNSRHGGSIKKSFSIVSVSTSSASVGGLVGGGGGVVENSYWNLESSGQTNTGSGIRKTGSQLKSGLPSRDIFTGWSTAIWNFGTISDYPQLINDSIVNGGWSDWYPTSCTYASRQTRTCTNPEPRNDGATCSGGTSRACQTVAPTTITGTWSQWGACSASGAGVDGFRTRMCTVVEKSGTCDGFVNGYVERQECQNGEWTDWYPTTCAHSTRQTRTCTNPTPKNGGATCSGLASRPCPEYVDADGDGLIDIQTLEQLNNVRYNLDGTSYKTSADDTGNTSGCPKSECIGYELLNDIDAVSFINWEPIGNVGIAFSSTFDGNGYKIENLKIDRPTESFIGLFGWIDTMATIENIGVVDVSVKGDRYVGGLVGVSLGAIENSHVSGSVSGTNYVAGLVGDNRNLGSIKNSFSTTSISGSTEYLFGGLTTSFSKGTVENSYWDVQSSGIRISTWGIGKTTQQLKSGLPSRDIFIDWDTEIWDFGTTSDYPQLINNKPDY